MYVRGVFLFICFLLPVKLSSADTFTNRNTGDVLHGYVTSRTENDKTRVYTVEKGFVPLDLTEWDRTVNRLGRKNKVTIIPVGEGLMLQIVTEALEEALVNAADGGPQVVILEINSPGGRADYVERICDRIIRTDYCPVVAFVRGGRHGGALGGAAALALACDRIYMSDNTIIGAATVISSAQTAAAENLSVAWQEYLTRLASRQGRDEVLVRAMVDADIEVVEISAGSSRVFLRRSDVEEGDNIVRVWSRAGALLTLTAAEAAECGIAETVVGDRASLLRELDLADAEIQIDDGVTAAAGTFRKVKLKFARLRNSLDGKIKRIEQTQNIEEAVNLLRDIKGEYKSLLLLARRYPDLYLDVELIEGQLESAEDYYQQAKVKKQALTGDVNERNVNNK